MIDYIEMALRWFFGFQMVFWGLNGLFNWIKITTVSETIDHFVQACIEVRFIMPTVKIFEILFGFLIIFNFLTAISLIALCPLMFVITGLHILHNPKPWGVLLSYTLPFVALLFLFSEDLLRLVH